MADANTTNDQPGNEITVMLERWAAGDAQAIDDLLPQVYGELRKLARSHLRSERADHTLSPTGLVHDAYMRLLGSELKGATHPTGRHSEPPERRSKQTGLRPARDRPASEK